MKVMHVVLSLRMGGSEWAVVELARMGRELGQHVSIICLEERGPLAARLEALGETVACLDKPPGIRLTLFARLWSRLRDWQPDIVHTHQLTALFYTGPVARAVHCPLIVHTQHGRHPSTTLRRRLIGWLACRCASRCFCVSSDIAQQTEQLGIAPAWKLAVVPNGIDSQRFQPWPRSDAVRQSLGIGAAAPVVGTVGRLEAIKRPDTLLRVFAAVHLRIRDAHLIVVGGGSQFSALQDLARQLDIAECVHFVGPQELVLPYLHALNVFVLTSASEGLPLAVLEAAAANVPVVASRVGGLPEILVSEQSGVLCDPDAFDQYVEAIVRILEHPTYAQSLSDEARRIVVSRHDVRGVAACYQEHYLRLLNDFGSNPFHPCPTV